MVRSRTCSASPTEPLRSWSETSTLAWLMASDAAFLPMLSMYPDSSVMSVMFTLMRYRPILLSSGATLRRIASRNFSRSWLICSMVSEATVRRS